MNIACGLRKEKVFLADTFLGDFLVVLYHNVHYAKCIADTFPSSKVTNRYPKTVNVYYSFACEMSEIKNWERV